MSQYKAPLRDMRFALFDVVGAEALYQRLPGCSHATRELVDAVLEEAARFTETVLAPLNAVGDEHGCRFDAATGDVSTPPGFAAAYRQFVDNGWAGLTVAEAYGGQDLPESVGAVAKEMIDAANLAWGTYPLLSHGQVEALKHHGAQWQRDIYLSAIASGRWTGTMCLTEPHCGTDLGLLRTRAEPLDEAGERFAVSGTKIFITAGEHDFTDNIVHLVLARLPDAPPGTKGISLFIVPKFKVDREGNMGERNALRCGAIEHKMGLKGSATCVMNFDGAEGWLIGEPHRGLAAMFTMMNTARLAVGLQGLALIDRAYQNSLRYAKERLQMRALSGAKYPDRPADPIIVHPDVRRMLLTQKAFAEGGRAMAHHAATLVDVVARAEDPAERQAAEELLSFVIPIVKGVLTEAAVECTYDALQIFGGHGYIREHGMEQLARDARITTLYEGTTQIQALDLLGRKVMQLQGAGLKRFLAMVSEFCSAESANPALGEFIPALAQMTQEFQSITLEVGRNAMQDPDEIGAAAVDYLWYAGYVSLAYWWARSVAAAERSAEDATFRAGKRETARFFYTRLLPRALAHGAAIRAGAQTLLAIPEEAL